VKDKTGRPVMFVFNSGPGASSSPLHFSAFGPRRRGGPGDSLRDNPYSPLDAVDLVFIDPIGTGFPPAPRRRRSTVLDHLRRRGVGEDVHQSWLKVNGREASPRFLCGESYGTVRAGEIVSAHKDLTFDGVLLFSLVARPTGPEMPYVVTLPTFAVTAAFHGKVDPAGRSVSEIFEEAATFARTDYIGALIQGDALPAAEKTRIAQELSNASGCPPISSRARTCASETRFHDEPAQGTRRACGQLDSRATGEFARMPLGSRRDDRPWAEVGSDSVSAAGTGPTAPQAPAPAGEGTADLFRLI
jgi:carboxypeptidase C (cathepsin A)